MISLLTRLFSPAQFNSNHSAIIREIADTQHYWRCRLEDFCGYEKYSHLSLDEKCNFTRSLCTVLDNEHNDWTTQRFLVLSLKQKLPFDQAQIIFLLDWHARQSSNYQRNIGEMLKILDVFLKKKFTV